jgi:hypothetical protein
MKRYISFAEIGEMLRERERLARITPGAQVITLRLLKERVFVTCYRFGEFSGSTPYEPTNPLFIQTVQRLLREGWIVRPDDTQTQELIARLVNPSQE